MCGRFVLKSPPQRIRDRFGIAPGALAWSARYNIAPLQAAPVLRLEDGARRLDLLRWGLVPSWAGDPEIANRLINARAETVAQKPSFRAAFKARRCVVPADGFFEWQQAAHAKQPYYIQRRDGALLALAGLWEHWHGPGGATLQTFTLLTTEANAWMRPLHERMPVILDAPEAIAQWLDPGSRSDALLALLRPARDDVLQAWPVGRAVGNTRHDGPELIEPAPAAEPDPGPSQRELGM
jgi:putative SOS response-associated peptidase YedK